MTDELGFATRLWHYFRYGGIGAITRLWFYFRIGYGTYLTFFLGATNTLVVVWYLAISHIPIVQNLFGGFLLFAVFTIVIGVPLSVGIGWLHLKGSPAYRSEMDIGVEANPWYYKYPPGYTREAWGPLFVELLSQNKRLLKAHDLLNEEEKARIEKLEQRLRILNEGGTLR
jgi:hypothetical protein